MLRPFGVGALFLGLLAAIGSAPSGAETQSANIGAAPSLPAAAQFEGPLAADTPMHVSIALRPSDPGGLGQLATEVSTPDSPEYHQYLAPTEIEQRFGPGGNTLAATRSWLSAQGLTVGATSGDGLDVPASGTAAQVGAAFRVPIDHYQLASGRQIYANTAPPEMPAGLQPAVAAVLGLDDLVQPSDDLSPTTPGPPASPAPGVAHPSAVVPGQPTPCSAASQAQDLAPGAPNVQPQTADLVAQRYQLTPLYGQGNLGQGTTVGLLELYDFSDANIAAYDNCYGITTSYQRINVDGGATPGLASFEDVTDIDMVASVAPRATVLLYMAPFGPYSAVFDAYAAMVQDNRAQVISSSWLSQQCEADMINGGTNTALVEAPLFEAMAIQGQTIVSGAGDAGSESCVADIVHGGTNLGNAQNPYSLAVVDPANQPFITSVGGTSLLASGGAEVTWNRSGPSSAGDGFTAPFDGQDGRINGYGGFGGNTVGGGGISSFFQMPPWQVGFDQSGLSSGAPCGAPAGAACRELPDVSALAEFLPIYFGELGGWVETGGTSASNPLWAGFLALVDETIPRGRLGLVSPALYQIDAGDPSAFFDVTQGNNDYLAQGGNPNNYSCTYNGIANQPCYKATPGYDMASGLGTPNGARLAADLEALQFGYTLVASDGGVFAFGSAGFYGSMGGRQLNAPVVGLATTPGDLGYFEVASDGGIFAFGTAAFYGSMGGLRLNEPVVGMAATADGQGYWEVASDGGLFAFGDAAYYGSMGGTPLSQPVVGMAATPDGKGYWEVASDGGLFAFGDAAYYGSMGGQRLNAPVVGIAGTADGKGYWEVASDGGIFAFGDASFYGSRGGQPLNQPVVGLAAASGGYWEVARDGGVFAFGAAQFLGSTGNLALNAPVVGTASGG